MARKAKDGLSRHATKGFRLKIGKQPSGKFRTFWLGHRRVVAEYFADNLRGRFEHMKDQGRDVWTDEDVETVMWHVRQFKAMVDGLHQRHALDVQAVEQKGEILKAVLAEAPAASPPQQEPQTEQKLTLNLHGAIDAFVEAFKNKAVAPAHKERVRQLMDDLKHFRLDVPLKDIDRIWLQTLTDHIKSRPKSRKRKTPLAPYTVRNMLRAWARFFDWLDANADSHRFGHWQAPRRWQELFEVRLTQMMSKAERDAAADGPKHLTLEQVVSLYGKARNDLHRICILLGIFAGLGQREIASLRRDEFNLETGILSHRRSKTSQLGKFWLPPQAVTLIRRYFRKVRTDAENTAFFTAARSKLVSGSSDAIRQAWSDIVDRVINDGVKIEKGKQGFYHLRKFVADYAMRNGGPVVRDTLLAHAPDSIGGKHYSNTRDFEAVFEVGRKLHADLVAKGMFSKVKRQRQRGNTKAAA